MAQFNITVTLPSFLAIEHYLRTKGWERTFGLVFDQWTDGTHKVNILSADTDNSDWTPSQIEIHQIALFIELARIFGMSHIQFYMELINASN